MRRLLRWAWNDLKRDFADLDASKLMLIPLVYLSALAVAHFIAKDWCQRWPTSLRCSVPALHTAEADIRAGV